jgi:hypothetical protein
MTDTDESRNLNMHYEVDRLLGGELVVKGHRSEKCGRTGMPITVLHDHIHVGVIGYGSRC